jgi:recombination protein RecT
MTGGNEMSKAIAKKEKELTDLVTARIKSMISSGDIDLPFGYSASNSLKEAYLILRETLNRNKQPVLTSCTPESISNALLNTIVMGFSPARKHCYYIAYGDQLVCQPSYLGNQMLAKRLNPELMEINAQVIYSDDALEIEVVKGKTIVTKHKQSFQTALMDNIVGAYAVAVDLEGEIINCVIMTKEDILTAWKQSKQHPVASNGELKVGSVHEKFSGEMAKRTVINRLCKTLISTSADNSYLGRSIHQNVAAATNAEFKEIAVDEANSEMIDVQTGEVVEESFEPIEFPDEKEVSQDQETEQSDSDPFTEPDF